MCGEDNASVICCNKLFNFHKSKEYGLDTNRNHKAKPSSVVQLFPETVNGQRLFHNRFMTFVRSFTGVYFIWLLKLVEY